MTTEVGLVNLLLQGGAFGLLCWLAAFWLPRAAANMSGAYNEAVRTFREQEREQRRDHAASLASLLAVFQAEAKYEREQCSKHFGAILEAINRDHEAIRNGQEAILDVIRDAGSNGRLPLSQAPHPPAAKKTT